MTESNQEAPTIRLIELGVTVDKGSIVFLNTRDKAIFKAKRSEFDVGGPAHGRLEDFHKHFSATEMVGYCCCRNEAPAQFHVRKRRNTYQICRSPVTGRDHAPDCKNWPASPIAAPVSRKSRDKQVDLLFSAKSVGEKKADGQRRGYAHKHGTRSRLRGPSTLDAALLALLDTSGLNEYRPSDWLSPMANTMLADRLLQVLEARARARTTGRQQRLPPILVSKGRPVDRNLLPRRDLNCTGAIQPVVLIGSVRLVERDGGKAFVYLEGESALPIVYDEADWDREVRHSFRPRTSSHLLARLGTENAPHARVIVALTVTWNGSGEMQGHSAGLCPTTPELVPVESLHELQMANYLIKRHRHFIKDITLPEGYRYRPDFRLLDLGKDFIIEVNGRDDPKYIEQKQAMLTYLEENFSGRYLVWWPEKEPLSSFALRDVAAPNG